MQLSAHQPDAADHHAHRTRQQGVDNRGKLGIETTPKKTPLYPDLRHRDGRYNERQAQDT